MLGGLIALSLFSLPSFALASDESDDGGCPQEFRRFCPGAEGEEMFECAKAHISEISDACRNLVRAKMAERGGEDGEAKPKMKKKAHHAQKKGRAKPAPKDKD